MRKRQFKDPLKGSMTHDVLDFRLGDGTEITLGRKVVGGGMTPDAATHLTAALQDFLTHYFRDGSVKTGVQQRAEDAALVEERRKEAERVRAAAALDADDDELEDEDEDGVEA